MSQRLLLLSALFLVAILGVQAASAVPIPLAKGGSIADEDPGFRLSAPQPNPFVSATRMDLVVEETATLTVTVFDALGREVVRLHEGTLTAGHYPLTFDGESLPTGLYVVRAMDEEGHVATRSVALVR